MPAYKYTAVDIAGAVSSGRMEASSESAVVDGLHRRGLTPLDIRTVAQAVHVWERLGGALTLVKRADVIRLTDLIAITQSLAALLKAGLTVDRAMSIAGNLTEQSSARRFFDAVGVSVRAGQSFADALTAAPGRLPPYYISMVQAGEASGSLPATLSRLAELLRKQHEVRERISSAMVYPILLAGIVMLTVIVLLTFVLPRFQTLFAESDAPLPLSTRVVLALGNLAASHWWLISGLIAISLALLLSFLHSKQGQERFDRWILRSRWTFGLPLKLNTARMLRTIAVLVQNGVVLPAALRLARGTLSNSHLQKCLDDVGTRVKAGQSLTNALHAVKAFPPHAIQLSRVGEETGRLDELLLEASSILESESHARLERLLTLLVPGLTIFMGLIVAALIGSVLIGLLSVNELAF